MIFKDALSLIAMFAVLKYKCRRKRIHVLLFWTDFCYIYYEQIYLEYQGILV